MDRGSQGSINWGGGGGGGGVGAWRRGELFPQKNVLDRTLGTLSMYVHYVKGRPQLRIWLPLYCGSSVGCKQITVITGDGPS